MDLILRHRATPIWVALIAATWLSWEFGHGLGFGEAYHYASVAVILIAFVKARFVFLDFMELRGAPRALRLAFEGWTLVVCAILLLLYWRAV